MIFSIVVISIIFLLSLVYIVSAIWFIYDSLKKEKYAWANIMIIALGLFLIATLNFLTQIF